MIILSDYLTLFWLLAIDGILLIIPYLFLNSKRYTATKFIRLISFLSIGILFWLKLNLLTWFTSILTYVITLMIINADQPKKNNNYNFLQGISLRVIDIFDRGISLKVIRRSIGKKMILFQEDLDRIIIHYKFTWPQISLSITSLILSLGLSFLVRLEEPIAQLRYSSPETYQQLLVVQQIVARNLPFNKQPYIWEAIASFNSIITGVDPQQTVRFFGASIGFILIVVLGYTVYKLTKNFTVALIGIYSLGIYIFTWKLEIPARIMQALGDRSQAWLGSIIYSLNQGYLRQWNNNEAEIAVIFTLLAIASLVNARYPQKRSESIINLCACVGIVAIVNPHFIVLVIFAAFSMVLGREVALFTVSITWLFLSLFAALPNSVISIAFLQTLPIALTLNLTICLLILIKVGRLILNQWSGIIWTIIFIAITINFCLPKQPQISYLEYEMAARKTLEIKHLYPRKSWTIVAPVEQLSQTYGIGWYEDLAKFVYKYSDKVNQPDFNLPYQTPHIFVFVEKRPFKQENNPLSLPYSTFADPTYQNYRSPSGRMELEEAAKRLSEQYLATHPQGKIYYEDEDLKIYYFPTSISLKNVA